MTESTAVAEGPTTCSGSGGAALADRPHRRARRVDQPGQHQPRSDVLNDHLMRTRSADFAQVLAAASRCFSDILKRGVTEGEFRPDLDVERTAAIDHAGVLGP